MLTFTLAISFDHFQFALIHRPNILGSYAILLFIASDFASITIHNRVLFLLWLYPFILLGLFLYWSPVPYWASTDLGSSSFSVLSFFAFSCCSGGSESNNMEILCDSLLQWTTFCQNSPPWPNHLGWPYIAWLIFIELDKAVVHVIRLASFLWLWFQSACPLMPSLSTYCLTGVSVTLDVRYLFTAPPAKHSCCSLPWTWGISSYGVAQNHCYLFRVVKKVLHVEVVFERRSKRTEEINYAGIWGKNWTGIEEKYKVFRIYSRYSKEASGAATLWWGWTDTK